MDADPSTMDLDLSFDEEIAVGWEDSFQGQTQSIELQQGDYGTVNLYLSAQGDLDHGCGPHHHSQTCSCIEQNRNQVSPAATALDSFYVAPNPSPSHVMLHNPQCPPCTRYFADRDPQREHLDIAGEFYTERGDDWADVLIVVTPWTFPPASSGPDRTLMGIDVLALPSSTTVTRGQDDTRILRPEPPSRLRVDGEVERALTRKRRRSPSPNTKRAKVRMEYYINCFQGDLRPLRCPDPGPKTRTRSAKVCFRCQDQKLKCEGGFPCKKCCDVARRGRVRVKYELPCIDADLHALNPFFDLSDIKPHRKIGLGLVLIALLIGAEHRGTYILDSLRLKFEQKSFGNLETIGEHLTRIVGFICRGMTTMNHLRLCLRHFLRKLFGNGQLPQEFWELVVDIFGHFDDQLDPATFTPGHRDLDETRIRQQLFQRLQKYLLDSFPNSPPQNFGVTKEEFDRRVAYLGCEDLPKDTGPVGARRMKECLIGTKGTSPRYLDDHGLREFVQGLEKSGDSTLKRAASDPYQISGDSTYDTAFKYLFLKWMEG
ncbi:hypothetical protein QBC37DRAFT_452262 [Rhypophila decipiens]|uniref:Uncharacterized protein n=1 Tax=Rhypophila decipiens TaxID=261697 RepID=A0AAN7B0Y6_9PEZI|nr:hypothetical protein QBC37DRAFT_452262 [Rhypophila decipiens]